MKDVIFLFSPLLPGSSSSPYLAPHLLSTILRKNGFNVYNHDLNRAFVDQIGERRWVEKTKSAIDELYAQISGQLPKEVDSLYVTIFHQLDLLISNYNEGKTVQFQNKMALANILATLYLNDLKTVRDFNQRGLDIIAPMKELFYELLDKLDIDGKTICLSCAFGNQLPFTLEIARYLRAKKKNIKIMLGGAQISLLPPEVIEEIKALKLFNLVFSGYAEEKIAEAVTNCPDTFFEELTYGSTATSKMLDALPYTDFDEAHLYSRLRLPVIVNKGCYWGKCSFCDYILMGDLGGFRYISRSVDIVYDEIKQLRQKYPNSFINLISDAVPPKFYKELCERAASENFELRSYAYMINNKNLTEEFFQIAQKAKISTIIFGTESTNDRVLDLMQKQGRREDILRNLDHAKKYDLSVKVNLIPNYPTTTLAEALGTYQDIWQYEDFIEALAIFRFYLSANTKMDQSPEDYDLEINNDIPYLKSLHNGFHSRDFRTRKGMTPVEELKVYDLFYELAFTVSLNGAKKNFRYLLENSKTLNDLRLRPDVMFFEQNGKPAFYSGSSAKVHYVPSEDIPHLNGLRENKKTLAEISSELGDKARQWLEHYYALELLEFAS